MFKQWVQVNLIGLSVILFFQLIQWINSDIEFIFHPWKVMFGIVIGSTISSLIIKFLMIHRKEWFEDDVQ